MREKGLPVYNLHVRTWNTFAVGACEALVHNRKTDINQIREIGRMHGWTPKQVKHFGNTVEELKEGGFWDGVAPHNTLTWEQLLEAAKYFADVWGL